MSKVTFITGNQNKIDFMQKHIGISFSHQKLNLEEVQSMDLREISEYKARQAFKIIQSPVLVEDVGLYCEGLCGLPGPFVKWFLEAVGVNGICRLATNSDNSAATASICFTYFNGEEIKFFEGNVGGRISKEPKGNLGYGWDACFIPDGSTKTYAEMDDEEIKNFSLRVTTVFPKLKEFLAAIDKT